MLLFAGLGNPGAKYAGHRHNVGFMAADAIHRRHSFPPWTKKFQALLAEGRIGGEKVMLVKPQTFMNLSGQTIGETLRFFKLDAAALTVFYDELDLAPGKVRVKTGGGAGGHNGIRSIDAHVGLDYRRVRIGIGHPGVKEMVSRHVLGDFAKADREWLDPMLEAIADNAEMLVRGDESGFMNKLALAIPGRSGDRAAAREEPPPARQNHVKQAPARLPETGPMAAMLKKLFGNRD